MPGEGAAQRVERLENRPTPTYHEVPSLDRDDPTYYGLPMLKSPVWKASIPAYFYLGGMAGAAGVLAPFVAPALGRKLGWVNLVGTGLGSLLLIEDLGRPSRFLNMLRVFKVSSPMSVGSWALALNGSLTAGSLMLRTGFAGGALFAAAQVTYPGVLLACTAVPVWQESRRSLPFLFTFSSAGALAALGDLLDLGLPAGYGKVAKALELVAMVATERECSRVERVGRPLRNSPLWRLSGGLVGASLAVSLLPGRSKWKRRLSGLLGTAGAVALRFAVVGAGTPSSRDPRASFDLQRGG